MADEILDKLKKGCFKRLSNSLSCGDKDAWDITILCEICENKYYQHLESTQAERERVLKIIKDRGYCREEDFDNDCILCNYIKKLKEKIKAEDKI